MFEIYHSFFTLADTGKVDLVMNLVERVSRGFSAGGGISSGWVLIIMLLGYLLIWDFFYINVTIPVI